MLKLSRSAPLAVRILILIVIYVGIGEFVIGNGINMLGLPALVTLCLYKAAEVGLLVGLNAWLFQQRIAWRNLRWWTWLILGLVTIVGCVVGLAIGGWQRVLEALTIGAVGAIPEEFMFRGIVFGALIGRSIEAEKPRNPLGAIVITAGLFSCIHLLNLTHQSVFWTLMQMIQTFGMGTLFAGAYYTSGSLLAPLGIHFGINVIVGALNGLASSTAAPSFWVAIGMALGTLFYVTIYSLAAFMTVALSTHPPRLPEALKSAGQDGQPVRDEANQG